MTVEAVHFPSSLENNTQQTLGQLNPLSPTNQLQTMAL